MRRTIKQLRVERGVTQLQLATALGVTPITVSNWERGEHEPKASQLRRMAELFGVSMDDIDFPVPPPGKANIVATIGRHAV